MSAAGVKTHWLASEEECLRRLRLYQDAAKKGAAEWNKIVPATCDARTPDRGYFEDPARFRGFDQTDNHPHDWRKDALGNFSAEPLERKRERRRALLRAAR
jgi:hypothetical protein